MSLKENKRKKNILTAFSNLRLLTFIFIFFIFLIFGITVLVISSQTKENIISLARSEVQSDAAIAALQIDGDALATLHTGNENDRRFLTICDQLEAIQKTDDKIRYVYTLRKSATVVEFIVDGDYGHTSDAAKIGQEYPYLYPGLLAGFVTPTADSSFKSDTTGTYLSGYAPIRNSYGDVVVIVGVDIDQKSVVQRFNNLDGIFFFSA